MISKSYSLVCFCISAFMFSMRYLCVSLLYSGIGMAGTDMFRDSISIFDSVYPLLWISIVVFILGVILLVIPVIRHNRQNIDRFIAGKWN